MARFLDLATICFMVGATGIEPVPTMKVKGLAN